MMAQRKQGHSTQQGAKGLRLPYRTGEKGVNRVRLYAHPKTGHLQLEFYDETGARRARSLGHTDVARGKLAADELAAKLRAGAPPPSQELTLGGLFDRYDREVTPTKASATQQHDRAARALLESCWGRAATVRTLDRRDWDRFIQARRAGTLKPEKSRREGGVGSRQIAYDLQYVVAACHWAETVRERGQPLLERHPFKGFPLPTETSPRRPMTTAAEVAQLEAAAAQVGGVLPLFLTLVAETGHRCMAVARLRWADVDLKGARITWRRAADKMRREHVLPVSAVALAALKAARRASPRIGDGWLFPSPENAEQHASRHLVRDWWTRLETLAQLERIPGRGWHSLRRRFATDHRALPLADLMALGGWKDAQTIVKCYQHPDEAGLRDALESRGAKVAGRR